MRVTEGRMLDTALGTIGQRMEQIAHAGDAVSTGVAVDRPSRDPAAWLSGMRAAARGIANGERRGAVDGATEQLQAADGALAGVGESLAQLQEIAVQLANGTYSAEDRVIAAQGVEALRTVAIASANGRGPDGTFVLSGTETDAPFDTAGAYTGDAGVRHVEIGEGGELQATNVPGTALTAANGVDVFALFGQVEAALLANDQTQVQSQLDDIDAAIGQVAQTRSAVGERMSVLRSASDASRVLADNLTATVDRSLGTDPFSAASELAQLATGLEAARAVTQSYLMMFNGAISR